MNTAEADSADDDAWMEAEIQRQLDALTPQNADDVDDDQEEDCEEVQDPSEEDDTEDVPDSVKQYLERVQHRSEYVEKELKECDDLLKKADAEKIGNHEEDEFYYDSVELKELAFQLGEDPEELRDRVMSEVKKDELLDAEQAEREDAQSRMEEERKDEERQEDGEEPDLDQKQDTMVVALVSESDKFEQEARAKIRELEGRQSQMDHVRHEDREIELRGQARRDRQMDEDRVQRHKELDAEQQKLTQERMVVQAKAEAELEKETKLQEESLKKYQAEIDEFARKMHEEKEELERQLQEDKEKKEKQVYHAAVTIQAAYRSYRARKPYLKKLRQLEEGRAESKIQLRQMEIAEQRKQAEVKKKKDKAEKKKREEAERKKQEELQKRLEEERIEQERKEKERQVLERKEKERQEAERLEAERLEKERLQREKEIQEKEKLEMEQKTQDILAKIAAEKAGSIPGITDSTQSTDSEKSPDSSLKATLESTTNCQKGESSNSAISINNREVLSVNDNASKNDNVVEEIKKIATMQHEDITMNRPSEHAKSSLVNLNSNQNQTSMTGGPGNTAKSVLDKNDNIHSRSLHGHTQGSSHVVSEEEGVSSEINKTVQSKTFKGQVGETFATQGVHDNHIGNSNNHASTQNTLNKTVVNSTHVLKSNNSVDLEFEPSSGSSKTAPGVDLRAPSGGDPKMPYSGDLCIAPGELLQSLPEETEKMRLLWIEKCTSLSKLLSDSKQRLGSGKQRRQLRRPRSAKKLPDLTDKQILAGSEEKTSLEQVTTVHLEDLPGFNVSTLQKCPRLQCVTVHRCGLTAVEGLENSPDVVSINAQHNAVESVNCRDRSQLSILHLAHNHISNLQGLEGCPRLRWLEIQHNKLTRISGLEFASSITHLYASHNQLINANGLEALVCLQRLDLSHNHLSNVSGIEKCSLLRRLNLSCNSLTEVPNLTNNVLLRELYLDDNSLSSLDAISDAWLPMLTTLSVSQNSLPGIPILNGCRLLKSVDITHNFISDVECLTPGLEMLEKLEQLSIAGNAVTEEQTCREAILKSSPNLKVLDDETSPGNHGDKKPVLSQFEAMCLSQMQAQDDLQATQQGEIEKLLRTHSNDTLKIAHLKSKHMEDLYKQAVEHRYMHEYGDMTIIARQPNLVKVNNGSKVKTKERDEKKDDTHRGKDISREINNKRSGSLESATIKDSEREILAATRIQARWRGYSLRRDIAQHTTYWLSAVAIQSAWRRYAARKDGSGLQDVKSDATPRVRGKLAMVAATKIQTVWRGYSIRKRLKRAKQTIKFDDEDDMFGEIDLTSFEFNEDSIEQGWLPAPTPVIPSSHPVLPPAASLYPSNIPHKPSPPTGERPLSRQLRQAWRNSDSPLLDPFNKNLSGKPPLPPMSQHQDARLGVGRLNLSPSPTGLSEDVFDERSQQGTPLGRPPIPLSPSTVLDTPRSNRSHKTDQLSEEWGFKDSTTAELMMRRAKKLHKGKKKKLDPIQRYKMMKKTQEVTTSRASHVAKKGVQRKEYFKAREEEIEHAYHEKKEEEHERKYRTFDWVHNQVGDLEVSDSRINPRGLSGRQSNSEPNLPRMSPDVLTGRIQLMASPSLELQSVDGASSVASLTHRNRSNSYSTPDVQLPPIKTNSAPSSHYKERMAAKQTAVKHVHIAWGKTPRSGGGTYR